MDDAESEAWLRDFQKKIVEFYTQAGINETELRIAFKPASKSSDFAAMLGVPDNQPSMSFKPFHPDPPGWNTEIVVRCPRTADRESDPRGMAVRFAEEPLSCRIRLTVPRKPLSDEEAEQDRNTEEEAGNPQWVWDIQDDPDNGWALIAALFRSGDFQFDSTDTTTYGYGGQPKTPWVEFESSFDWKPEVLPAGPEEAKSLMVGAIMRLFNTFFDFLPVVFSGIPPPAPPPLVRNRPTKEQRHKNLIGEGETEKVEFKAGVSGTFSEPPNQYPFTPRQALVRAVAGLANRFGGRILLGVKDDGTIVGVQGSYRQLRDDHGTVVLNRDGYLRHITDVLQEGLGQTRHTQLVEYDVVQVDGKDVVVLYVNSCLDLIDVAVRDVKNRLTGDQICFVREATRHKTLQGVDRIRWEVERRCRRNPFRDRDEDGNED